MNSIPKMGSHLILDFHGTKVDLNNYEELNKNFTRIILGSGATIETSNYKQFDPQGLSILYLLSESHFSIHTWPEHGACAIDFYHCGETARSRMIKAEELLCEYLGWENCTGSMIIDRGTYHYSLIKQDEHTSVLYKKNKLVERQKSNVGETRLYNNENLGNVLSVNGRTLSGFTSLKNLNCFFDDENALNTTNTTRSPLKEKERDAQEEDANVFLNCKSLNVSNIKQTLLVIGCGDLTLPQEILTQGFYEEVVVYDTSSDCKERIKLLSENSTDLKRLFNEQKLIFTNDEFSLEPAKYSGIIVIDKSITIRKANYYLTQDGYYAEIIESQDDFKEVCLKENLKKCSFHTISNNINRFLIGKGRYS